MPTKNYSAPRIDPEQRELIERAQERARRKRRLYLHFILFLLGSVVLILLNVLFDVGKEVRPLGLDWFVWAIGLWFLIFLAHTFNVYVTHKFLGKEWENRQIDRLVVKQQERIELLRNKVEKKYPLPKSDEPIIPPVTDKPIDPGYTPNS